MCIHTFMFDVTVEIILAVNDMQAETVNNYTTTISLACLIDTYATF